jgi:hypothetical protein
VEEVLAMAEVKYELEPRDIEEWVRLEQADGAYIYVKSNMITSVGETVDGKAYVQLLSGTIHVMVERPDKIVHRIRAAIAAERKAARL